MYPETSNALHYYLIQVTDKQGQTMNLALLQINDHTRINHLIFTEQLNRIYELMTTVNHTTIHQLKRYLKRLFYADQQLLMLKGPLLSTWTQDKIKQLQNRIYPHPLKYIDLGCTSQSPSTLSATYL